MTDQPPPKHQAPGRQPGVGTLLYEFVRESDGAFIHCELVDERQSLGGVEVRIFIRDELSMTYRFDSPRLAEVWAKQLLRPELKKGGA